MVEEYTTLSKVKCHQAAGNENTYFTLESSLSRLVYRTLEVVLGDEVTHAFNPHYKLLIFFLFGKTVNFFRELKYS